MNVDFKLFDWEEIFGTVKATEGLKRKQTRGLRTEIQEIATAKYSNNQFEYVGMREDGHDYLDCHGIFWEDKGQGNMFQKTTGKTAPFTLKNWQGNSKSTVHKTFDYILVKDTKKMCVGWSTWDAVYKNIDSKDAQVYSHIDYDDLYVIELLVISKQKSDVSISLQKLIEDII